MAERENEEQNRMYAESSSSQAPQQADNANSIKKMRDKVLNIIGKKNENSADNAQSYTNTQPQPAQVNIHTISEEFKPYTDADMPDMESMKKRIVELEEHVIKIHKEFDKFVIDSDQFLNRQSFMELKNEFNERMKALDRLENSIEESKKEILKDASYMDDIVHGFTYVKTKIEALEKKINDNLQTMSSRKDVACSSNQADSSKMRSELEAEIEALRNEIRMLRNEKVQKMSPVAHEEAPEQVEHAVKSNPEQTEINGNIDKLKALCVDI